MSSGSRLAPTVAGRLTTTLAILAVSTVLAGCLPESAGPSRPPATPAPPTASPTPSGPTPIPSFAAPTATPMPTFLTHTVVAGDSLVALARRYETTGRSIAYWNRLTYPSLDPESPTYSPNRIEIGWRLVLIPGVVVDPDTLPSPTPSPTPEWAEPPDPTSTP